MLDSLNKQLKVRKMEDNKFWYKVWRLVAVCFIFTVLSTASCNVIKANKVAEAVTRGENPIAARCMYSNERDDVICIAYVMKAK